MATKIDALLATFENALCEPWPTLLSGSERIWFLVFDPAELRRVELRMGDFEAAARRANRRWIPVSLKPFFPEWMTAHEYREGYFESPEDLIDQLEADFKPYVVQRLTEAIQQAQPDNHTLIVLQDVSALFGLIPLSDVLRSVTTGIQGRMLVFFPGEYQHNQYRLLDARDGWNYLARPIL
ncbi:DUF1788 domain-containing protein [Fibrisoma montanum]|uniref:DUF1788 domain-containing protein n=1 Tax=Fibrisoma montanum TaxID=2305895 RepID=A0A418MIR7_9BACT|nr:BREX protein BrxB domain-containing protein [Fibrisoma montanum]RIV27355.1 DUF1788 domain-containing protein [Fibrisoma montanum]